MKRWRVVEIVRMNRPVESRTYETADEAAAAAFGYRTKHPDHEFAVREVVGDLDDYDF